MDNSISKWTLLEAKLYCKNRGHKSGCCEGCRIADDNGYCAIQNAPEKWDIAEETDATDATDTNVGHKPEKPRLAEVLGVDVNERFQVNEITLYVDWMGVMRVNDKNGTVSQNAIYTAINHPESIIRAPRLTEAERIFLQGIPGVKWVSRDVNADDGYVDLWGAKPELIEGCYNGPQGIGVIGRISSGLCISVHPGDCIEV